MKKIVIALMMLVCVNVWAYPTKKELNEPWTQEEIKQGWKHVGKPEIIVSPGTKYAILEKKIIASSPDFASADIAKKKGLEPVSAGVWLEEIHGAVHRQNYIRADHRVDWFNETDYEVLYEYEIKLECATLGAHLLEREWVKVLPRAHGGISTGSFIYVQVDKLGTYPTHASTAVEKKFAKADSKLVIDSYQK